MALAGNRARAGTVYASDQRELCCSVSRRGSVARKADSLSHQRYELQPIAGSSLHSSIRRLRVRILAVQDTRLRVGDLEALDGTPVLDVKPVLDRRVER
jgi:hypothetical protein